MEDAKKRAEQRKKRPNQTLGSVLSYGWAPNYNGHIAYKNVDFTSDYAGGRQYTSFEKKNGYDRKNKNASGKLPALGNQKVEDIPIGMETDDYVIKPDNLVCFSGTQHFLSNFYASTINIDGHDYQSVEHYYQACKLYTLAGAEFAAQLRQVNNPGKVKTSTRHILGQLRVGQDRVDEWKKTHGFVLLHHALVHKFVQNMDLRQKLLETGNKILVHTFDRDNLFATGTNNEDLEKWAKDNQGKALKIPVDINIDNLKYIPLTGKGKNLLGIISMKVRKQLANYKSPNEQVETDPLLSALLDDFKLSSINDKPGTGRKA